MPTLRTYQQKINLYGYYHVKIKEIISLTSKLLIDLFKERKQRIT